MALKFAPRLVGTYSHVHQTGYLRLESGELCSVVVADHPELKKRWVIGAEILDAFHKLSIKPETGAGVNWQMRSGCPKPAARIAGGKPHLAGGPSDRRLPSPMAPK